MTDTPIVEPAAEPAAEPIAEPKHFPAPVNGDDLMDWMAQLWGWDEPTRTATPANPAPVPDTILALPAPAPTSPIPGIDEPWGLRPATAGILEPGDEVHDHDAVYTVAEIGIPILPVWLNVGGRLELVRWRADHPLFVSRPSGWDDDPTPLPELPARPATDLVSKEWPPAGDGAP